MTTIITHMDADGICSASLVKMVPKYRAVNVYFSHPAGFLHDLTNFRGEDLIICDIALDRRNYTEIYGILQDYVEQNSVIYIDHHMQPDGLPPRVINVHNQDVSATELTYCYFYEELPPEADHVALIGAICDYLEGSPLMRRLSHHYERRTLYLDAGILAQGLKKLHHLAHYDHLRQLVNEFSRGAHPSDLKELTQAAISATKSDQSKRSKILSMYKVMENIVWVQDPPSMSYSKIAHWILGHSGKQLACVIRTLNSKRQLADITIRGWRSLDLRAFIPDIANNLGGSAGGHANAVGVRIPQQNLLLFLRALDQDPHFEGLPAIPKIGELINDFRNKGLDGI